MPAPADTRDPMRLLVDHLPSMLAYWDRDLLCRFANRAYERWFGVSPEALLGTSIRDLLGPKLFALNEPHIRGALGGEEQVFERIVPGPDGVERHSLAHYIPDTVDGEVRGFMVLVTEVTQLKQTQAALKREQALREEVESRARELDALLRERSDMLAVLAHEVQQPLNNASAALQSAAAALTELGERVASERVRRAQGVMSNVLSNIDNTLAVASLLAREHTARRMDVDIDMLVEVAIADMPPQDRPRIEVVRLTSTRTASMDMVLMRLALRNLLANALKFSPPSSRVVVRLFDSDEPLALVIEVEDSGPGVPAGLVPQLFERGARGDQAAAGHGLGLFIARRVMELHGGHIELARNECDGSVFRLVVDQAPAE